MDILMVYWNSVWNQALGIHDHDSKGASPEEWAAFERQVSRNRVFPSSAAIRNRFALGGGASEDAAALH